LQITQSKSYYIEEYYLTMAAITQKKTKIPGLFRTTLKFADNNTVNIAERDYGLMRVTAASGTPHPRVATGVNMDTLKERLEVEQEKNLIQEQREKNMGSGIRFKSDTERRSHKKMRLIETPHPLKGTNLDPQTLVPRLPRILKSSEQLPTLSPFPSSTFPNYCPTIKKTKETGTKATKKKVTLIPPRFTDPNYGSLSSPESCNQLELMSFNERRRIFHEGEFTIAKNGRKMSDNVMPITLKPIYIGDHIDNDAKAQAEIDLYMKSQGIIMAPSGTFSNFRF